MCNSMVLTELRIEFQFRQPILHTHPKKTFLFNYVKVNRLEGWQSKTKKREEYILLYNCTLQNLVDISEFP